MSSADLVYSNDINSTNLYSIFCVPVEQMINRVYNKCLRYAGESRYRLGEGLGHEQEEARDDVESEGWKSRG